MADRERPLPMDWAEEFGFPPDTFCTLKSNDLSAGVENSLLKNNPDVVMGAVDDAYWLQLDLEPSFAEQPHSFGAARDNSMGHSFPAQPPGGEPLTSPDLWDGSFLVSSGCSWDQGATLQKASTDNIALASDPLGGRFSHSETSVGGIFHSSSEILQDITSMAYHVPARGPDITCCGTRHFTMEWAAAVPKDVAGNPTNDPLMRPLQLVPESSMSLDPYLLQSVSTGTDDKLKVSLDIPLRSVTVIEQIQGKQQLSAAFSPVRTIAAAPAPVVADSSRREPLHQARRILPKQGAVSTGQLGIDALATAGRASTRAVKRSRSPTHGTTHSQIPGSFFHEFPLACRPDALQAKKRRRISGKACLRCREKGLKVCFFSPCLFHEMKH